MNCEALFEVFSLWPWIKGRKEFVFAEKFWVLNSPSDSEWLCKIVSLSVTDVVWYSFYKSISNKPNKKFGIRKYILALWDCDYFE